MESEALAETGEYEEDVVFLYPGSAAQPMVRTLPAKWLQVLCVLGLLAATILILLNPTHFSPNSLSYVGVMCQLGLCFIFATLDQFVDQEHGRLYTLGYLRFYKDAKIFAHVPLNIILAVNSLLFLSCILQHHYCGEESDCPIGVPRHYIPTGLLVAEVCFLLPALVTYMVQCIRFNSRQVPRRDIQLATTINLEEFQSTQRSDDTLRMLELQADIMAYLQKQQDTLNWTLAKMASKQRLP